MRKNTIFQLLGIGVLVYATLYISVKPSYVGGNSMEPALKNKERFFANKLAYTFSDPQRGDIVVYRNPKNENHSLISRIIGLPGDMVKLSNGIVYVNNQKLDEPYAISSTLPLNPAVMDEGKVYTVTLGSYFLLGDNRESIKLDSREFGFVSKKNLEGKYWIKY